ncbi:MAG: hypothetical protein OSB47_04325 [Pirellulaceae bacterium]|nr:hypothetical protein [Pirellulaceae bacterium]
MLQRSLMSCCGRLGMALLILSATGCLRDLYGPSGAGPTDSNVVATINNPLLLPVNDRNFLWNQLVDTIDDYFIIQREERNQVVGDTLTEGRIITRPQTGSTLLEPWRSDSTAGYERLLSTVQSIRRQATVRVIPQPNGYSVEIVVVKELENLDRPEFSTVGGAMRRHDGSLIDSEQRDRRGPVTLGWIPIGRDSALEQELLGQLRDRLTNVNRP